MDNTQLIEQVAGWRFSDWFPLTKEAVGVADHGNAPQSPGVYEIGLGESVPRLNGSSEIIYIGRGAGQSRNDRGSIAAALHRHIDNGGGPEKWLRYVGRGDRLQARFAVARGVAEARFWELLRLRWFIEQHWEPPAGNMRAEVAAQPMTGPELERLIKEWKQKAGRLGP